MAARVLGRMALILMPGFTACAPSVNPLSDEERSQIEADVRAAVDAFQDAQRRRDPEAIVSFLAPDFYMYGDGTRADYQTVAAQIRSTIPSLQRFETTWSDVEITALARDHALVSLVFRDVVTDGEGATTRLSGPTTFVWRLRDGEWRILYADADHHPDTS